MKPAPDPRMSEAIFPPNVVRASLNLARHRGHSPERLCKGLGFSLTELQDVDFKLSYRQVGQLIRRVKEAAGDPVLGLSIGARQTVVSWGLPGLAMMTCETLGEAMTYAIKHQNDAGALLLHEWTLSEREIVVDVAPRFYDSELEQVLVEEAFASEVAITRCLVGERFKPMRVEFAFAKPADTSAYTTFFQCPVRFDAVLNRLVSDSSWLGAKLSSYDEFTCGPIRDQLTTLMVRPPQQSDLLESMSVYLRTHLDEPRALEQTAKQFHISVRTLRRRLSGLGSSYRAVLDQIRYERAFDLLKRGSHTVSEVGLATGFADPRSFRRAFKRWSGVLPSEVTQSSH